MAVTHDAIHVSNKLGTCLGAQVDALAKQIGFTDEKQIADIETKKLLFDTFDPIHVC